MTSSFTRAFPQWLIISSLCAVAPDPTERNPFSMKQSLRSLVIGADSMLGTALALALEAAGYVVLTTSRQGRTGTTALDLSEKPSSWHIPSDIDVAFICAGITSVVQCRTTPELAWAVNVRGTAHLATRLVDEGAFVVFPSSNRVFDGAIGFQAADAPTCPVTEYGRTKAVAEELLLGLGSRTAVVRLTKILGGNASLVTRWSECLLQGKVIHPYADMVMAPVSATYVAGALVRVATIRLAGISQLSGDKDVTFEQVAKRLCTLLDAHQSLVQPVNCREQPDCVDHVPRHTTLDASRIFAISGISPPDLESTLHSVVRGVG